MGSYDDLIAIASERLGVPLFKKTARECAGPCPKCGGTDRFIVFLDGGDNGFCRQCQHKVYWGDNPQKSRDRAAEAAELREDELAQLRLQMHSVKWWTYHETAKESAEYRALWEKEGFSSTDMEVWGLGYCPACPTASTTASLTIPVFHQGDLMDIRHKLINPNGYDGKYRSHFAGLRPHPFNLDRVVSATTILLIEGEKKTMFTAKRLREYTVVGIPGVPFVIDALHGILELVDPENKPPIIVGLDPGMGRQGMHAALAFKEEGFVSYVADLLLPPDDLVKQFGVKVLETTLKQARRV